MIRGALKFSKNNAPLNQWDLIIAVIHVIRQTKEETWRISYGRVNLRPSTRVKFRQFIQRIAGFIAAGSTYKKGIFEPTALDKYAHISGFYHGMTSEEKKKGVGIVNKYVANPYGSMECIKELHNVLKINLSSMQDIRVCITLSIKHPDITDMVGPPSSQTAMATAANEQHVCVIGTACASVNANAGLLPFQLVPTDVTT